MRGLLECGPVEIPTKKVERRTKCKEAAMSERGSKVGRIVRYFREGDLDEVEVVLALAQKAVAERKPGVPVGPKPRRQRRSRRIAPAPPLQQTAVAGAVE